MDAAFRPSRLPTRALTLGLGLSLLAGCNSFDYDFRNLDGDPSNPTAVATAPRPQPDSRGVISYPTYQVAVARQGDTVRDVADRLGLSAAELARYNGIPVNAPLNGGEIIALPTRVATAGPGAGTITETPLGANGQVDITALAGNAIERAQPGATGTAAAPAGTVPVRHKVERGETAYSIARLYNVTPRALAEWNGLGPDLAVREGQFLLIPVPAQQTATVAPPTETTSAPGAGSVVATPPSAAKPLPAEEPAAKKPPEPASPQLSKDRTVSSKFAMPVQGSIIRGYQKGKNEGIDIAASAGSPVRAAANGTVAAITRDTDQVPILVIRHADNMLSVYANIEGISVKKGESVKRGQVIAKVRAGNPAFLHFELRKGFESVDPTPYLTP